MLKSCAMTSEEIKIVWWWSECTTFHFRWCLLPRGISRFIFECLETRHYIYYHAIFISLINYVSFTSQSLSQLKRTVHELRGTFESCLCDPGLTALTELQLVGNETVLHSHGLVVLMAHLCSFKSQKTISTDKVVSVPITSLFQIIDQFHKQQDTTHLRLQYGTGSRPSRKSGLFPYMLNFISLCCSCKFDELSSLLALLLHISSVASQRSNAFVQQLIWRYNISSHVK